MHASTFAEGSALVLALSAWAAFASDPSGPPAFLRRWLIYATGAAGLLAAGGAIGILAKSAMCAGPWMCTH